MIKAVVFDLDNTVYNYNECHSGQCIDCRIMPAIDTK